LFDGQHRDRGCAARTYPRADRELQKPESVDLVESLPWLFNGKIYKKSLRALYWQNQERQVFWRFRLSPTLTSTLKPGSLGIMAQMP
jgi:hypothetical protein